MKECYEWWYYRWYDIYLEKDPFVSPQYLIRQNKRLSKTIERETGKEKILIFG